MSLLTQMMEDCQILNRVRTDDAFGGYSEVWTPGTRFKAAIAKSSTPEQLVAEKKGVSEAFTVVVQKSFVLDYHDVFQRLSDSAVFRVTSRTEDSTAHPASTVKIAKVTAERWVIPA